MCMTYSNEQSEAVAVTKFTMPLPERGDWCIDVFPFAGNAVLHRDSGGADQHTEIHPIPAADVCSRIQKLSILPNNRCNFHCSYCYAAGDHDRKELSRPQAFAAADAFLGLPERIAPRVSFLGGGEPLLSWELVRDTILYIRKKNADIPINIVTNGSLITLPMLEFFAAYNIEVLVSFEILKDVQNQQRGSWSIVSENIKTMLAHGIPVKIRSILTDLNIHRIEEMANVVCKEYRGIKKWLIEPVSAWSFFPDTDKAMIFWDEYYKSLPLLKRILDGENVSWDSLMKRFFDTCSCVYCNGEFVVMTSGDIGMCHRANAPESPLGKRWLWGRFDGLKYQLDFNKAKEFYRFHPDMQTQCSNCPAAAWCGGNCRILVNQASPEYMRRYCSFLKECLYKHILDQCNAALLKSFPTGNYDAAGYAEKESAPFYFDLNN